MGKSAEYYREYRQRKFKKPHYVKKDMVVCLICHDFFVFLGAHIYQTHNMLMIDYKKHYGLDTKRGRTRGKFKELKRETNRNIENLKGGAKFRFVPKDKKAGRYTRSKETLERLHSLDHKKKYETL
jgi:hypothetical protein